MVGVLANEVDFLLLKSADCLSLFVLDDDQPSAVRAITSEGEAYRVYIGGRWGKKTARGIPLSRVFTSQDEVLDTVERAIILFRDEGITGERFSDTIARLGFDYVERKLLNN